MFRVHGTDKPKEIWRFDSATQKILIAYDELRYHLMPYIYSTAWQVTSDGGTMMRPLVMDFQTDTNVFNIANEYLFGPAILVCPVTQSNATTRAVYLPAGTAWFDFWTGKNYSGGQTIDAAAPIETEPLFVRAGSIIPYGPRIEYATQKNQTPSNCASIAARTAISRSTKTKATITIMKKENSRRFQFRGMRRRRLWKSENAPANFPEC